MSWDANLSRRGVLKTPYEPRGSEEYWKLVDARILGDHEHPGLHHILVETLNPDGARAVGVPITLVNGGSSIHVTEEKVGQDYSAAIPMYAAGYGYGVRIGDKSDYVSGMGLGTVENPHQKLHVSYRLVFQRVSGNSSGPTIPPPVNTNDWDLVRDLIRKIQGVVERNLSSRTFSPLVGGA